MYKNSLKELPYFHLINICVRDIYSSLMILRKNDFSSSHLRKMTRLMGYKYPMNLLNSRFTIFILYRIYIFGESLSKILVHTLSL